MDSRTVSFLTTNQDENQPDKNHNDKDDNKDNKDKDKKDKKVKNDEVKKKLSCMKNIMTKICCGKPSREICRKSSQKKKCKEKSDEDENITRCNKIKKVKENVTNKICCKPEREECEDSETEEEKLKRIAEEERIATLVKYGIEFRDNPILPQTSHYRYNRMRFGTLEPPTILFRKVSTRFAGGCDGCRNNNNNNDNSCTICLRPLNKCKCLRPCNKCKHKKSSSCQLLAIQNYSSNECSMENVCCSQRRCREAGEKYKLEIRKCPETDTESECSSCKSELVVLVANRRSRGGIPQQRYKKKARFIDTCKRKRNF